MDKLTITLDYDPHYCKYFETHSTNWNLELSDWLTMEMGEVSSVNIDGKNINSSVRKIEIPQGIGKHKIEVKF